MKEWFLYESKPGKPRRYVRLQARRNHKTFGLGIHHERDSTGTTYKEPGTNQHRAITVTIGPWEFGFLHYWKDMSQNRVDDPESYIYAQTKKP